MIEIVEIIWKHHEEAEAAALSLQQVTIDQGILLENGCTEWQDQIIIDTTKIAVIHSLVCF